MPSDHIDKSSSEIVLRDFSSHTQLGPSLSWDKAAICPAQKRVRRKRICTAMEKRSRSELEMKYSNTDLSIIKW
jgi:hypothetical protein